MSFSSEFVLKFLRFSELRFHLVGHEKFPENLEKCRTHKVE